MVFLVSEVMVFVKNNSNIRNHLRIVSLVSENKEAVENHFIFLFKIFTFSNSNYVSRITNYAIPKCGLIIINR